MPRPAKHQKGLTYQQEQFILEYLICENAVEACKRAGYKHANADVTSSKLMKNPLIQERLEKARQAKVAKHDVTFDRLVGMLIREAENYSETGAPGARVSAMAQLSKMLGFEKPKQLQVLTAHVGLDQLRGKSPDELQRLYLEAIDVPAIEIG